MKQSSQLDQEIKELEDKLGSLRAEQQLLKAQESLAREKASSLLEDETLSNLIQKLQNELVKCDLGLALGIDYKRNWVFIVSDRESKDGLSSFKILDPKDKRVFFGLVESFNQTITFEGIQTWLQSSLKLVVSLLKIKNLICLSGASLTFRSYDNVLDNLHFTLNGLDLVAYECVLTVKRPYTLVMTRLLNYDSEFSDIYFLGDGVSLQTRANFYNIHDDGYLGNFEQRLSVHQSFTKFSELTKVAKELEDKLIAFYEAIEIRFE
jgi:hypothetical protein